MASLFEQYEKFASTSSVGNTRPSELASANKNEGIINLRSNADEPIFAKNKIDFKPQHPITHMVVSNNQLLIAMTNRSLLKIDLMNPKSPIEIDLNQHITDRTKPAAISDIFIDPSGRHCIVSLCVKRIDTGGKSGSTSMHELDNRVAYENFYLNRMVHKLQKLKGFVISAVGWNHSAIITGQSGSNSSPSSSSSTSSSSSSTLQSTGNILIGTTDGRIFETQLQPDDRFLVSREQFFKFVCELPDAGNNSITTSTGSNFATSSLSSSSAAAAAAAADRAKEPICAINCFRLRSSSTSTSSTTSSKQSATTATAANTFCILVATSNFLYNFIGEISATSVVADSAYLFHVLQNPAHRLHKEMPGYFPASKLNIFFWSPSSSTSSATSATTTTTSVSTSSSSALVPKSFGWLTKPGIFYNDEMAMSNATNCSRLFDDASMIMLNDLVAANSTIPPTESPISLALTRFHILLLYPSALRVICTLNRQIIFEDNFVETYGRVVGICRDPIRSTIWVYTEHSVYRYRITREDRNIWQIYLRQKDFARARLYAGDDVIKCDRTAYEEALHHFAIGDYRTSADLFAGVRSRSFEEIALKFIELKTTRKNSNEDRQQQQQALKHYLHCKLRTLSPVKDRTPVIILLLWLFEIMLDQLGALRNRMRDCDRSTQDVLNLKVEYNKIEASFKDLISNSNYKACLKKNRKIIYNLILNHNNTPILIYFAAHIDDFERLLDHHLQAGEYDQALTILRQEECLALYYRYAPTIVQERPAQLISQLIPHATQIDFAKLIPALVHFDSTNIENDDDNNNSNNNNNNNREEEEAKSTRNERRAAQCAEIMRFLEFAVYTLRTDAPVVHNYLIALYAQYRPEKLLDYLQSFDSTAGTGTGGGAGGARDYDRASIPDSTPYDVRYAARLCTQLGHGPATVFLLATMGAVEEAVEQALADDDVELAKQTAEKFAADYSNRPEIGKRLWLKIAKYVIAKASTKDGLVDGPNSGEEDQEGVRRSAPKTGIAMATDILRDCALLKIEDILPYFPEFSTIDHFKDAICASLEEYNRNIESLRDDMRLATESATQIRDEIRGLRSRYSVIGAADRCSICEYLILSKPFYAFHCGHLFHADCLMDERRPLLSAADRQRLDELERALSGGGAGPGPGGKSGSGTAGPGSAAPGVGSSSATIEQQNIAKANRREEIHVRIDDIVADECFYCGHSMIASVDKPFIDPDETNAMKGWD